MPSQRQQPQPHGDDRERIARAREAAEALFTPKPPVSEHPSGSESSPQTDEPARKPRVLQIVSPAAPAAHEPDEPPVNPMRGDGHVIPRSRFARIRSWVKYGMTVSEAAEAVGAAVSDIERILRQP